MSIQISKRDIAWNYAGNLINIGSGILILPFILRLLSTNDLAIWYVYSSITAIVFLLDFGFSSAMTRNTTICWSGAKKLISEGLALPEKSSEPNYKLLKSLVKANKYVYFIMSLIGGIILLFGGTLYLSTIFPSQNINYYLSWIIYSIAVIINFYYSYCTTSLAGIGAIKQANVSMIISKILYIILAIIGLILGWGIIALSISLLLSTIVARIINIYYFKIKISDKLKDIDYDSEYDTKTILKTLLLNVRKVGLVSIGGFLISKTGTLLSSAFLNLEITAAFGLTFQLLNIIGSVSSLLFNTYVPAITDARMRNDKNRYKDLFTRSFFMLWIVAIMGVVFVDFVLPYILKFIGSNSSIMATEYSVVFGIVMLLEWNHSIFAGMISTENKIPYAYPAIISGFATILVSFILLNFTNLGIWSIIIAQGSVQLVFNNWYWPYRVCKEMKSNIFRMFIDGMDQYIKLMKRRTNR